MYRLWLLLILLAAGQVRETTAQALFGVEWHMPSDTTAVFSDFEQMTELGMAAVRTGAVSDSLVWQRAGRLGLTLFQEVDVEQLSAAQLLDTLSHAREAVLRMAFAASATQAIPYIGLARHSDTTDPDACAYYAALAETVNQWTNGRGRTYYLTAFIDDDVCHEAVDFVLLDALDASSPWALLRRWQRLHPQTPVGLGRLNWRVERNAASDGWKVPHTEAWQAHRMRAALDTLTVDPLLAHAFLYRWRDSEQQRTGQRATDAYGLYDASDNPRRVVDIVQQFLAGQARVFAYPAGVPPAGESSWPVLAGWMLILALGIGYAQSATLQQNVQRYFLAHSFYQEAVVRSRDLSTPLIVFFATLVAATNGLTLHAVLTRVEGDVQFWIALNQLPWVIKQLSTYMLTDSLGRLLLGVAFTLGSMLTWVLVLTGVARRTPSFSLRSAFYLVLWPRWLPTSFGVLMAMLLASGGVPATPTVLLLIAGLWLGTACYAFMRTLADYAVVVRPSGIGLMAAGIAYPPLVVLAVTAATLVLSPQWGWFWNLITRS